MALKPWYKVVTPREDLRDGKPLDASEFAVHLDHVRDGRAPSVYQNPEEFFQRTFLTQNLTGLAAEVVRRLSGEITETSAVFNLATQFGGGKTHALTLLYHLATHGKIASNWQGVSGVLERASIKSVPKAAVAVFVGTEFDVLEGRGGKDGTPLRKTPWGEIAYQLGGADALASISKHEQEMTAPGGDVLRRIIPADKPCLILMDELMNYISRGRKTGMGTQLYNFIQNLSEFARGCNNVAVAVSVPASEYEMTAEDQADYERLKKLLDRLGKAVMLSAEQETSEIIRRRLFEWSGLPDDAKKTIGEYADWIIEHRLQVPNTFPIDSARQMIMDSYPFHPTVLSVFERKWQTLPRFQRTRGVLRLLALWVSRAYADGFKGAHQDPLIGLGTAPLEDPTFRAAMFEQLGEPRLEPVVTTDIAGKMDSNAVRLDQEAVDTIKKSRLHRKVASTIMFESNGGQTSPTEATIPEIRLAVGEPGLDIGNIDTVIEALSDSCYYLAVDRNRYRFSMKENLNKRFSDRKATIAPNRIEDCVTSEVKKVFTAGPKVDRIFFPQKSSEIPDVPSLRFIVLTPEQNAQDERTVRFIETCTREYGNSGRTFKSALIWCTADSAEGVFDEARKLLAWQDIQAEEDELLLDQTQKRQLAENAKKAQRDLSESIWRSYKVLVLLDKENKLKPADLGLVHSSVADSVVTNIINRLRQQGDIEEGVSPNFLIRHWPPAFKEWSIRSVRDAFFASPQFPRLLNPDAIRDTIARGVTNGLLGYVGKAGDGQYNPFCFQHNLSGLEVDISEDAFIVTKEVAEAYVKAAVPTPPKVVTSGTDETVTTGDQKPQEPEKKPESRKETSLPANGRQTTKRITWEGEVPPQKWMNFYTKVLSPYATDKGLKLVVKVRVEREDGISNQRVDETKTALKELGLFDDVGLD
jgi:hypothetical protein